MSGSVELVAVRRGGVVEEVHRGTIVISDSLGQHILGRTNWRVPLRSTAKPFQIVPLLERGGIEAFGLESADIALMVGSHNGERAHTEKVLSLLHRAGFEEKDLNCGVHPAYFLDLEQDILRTYPNGPKPIHNNCSGKHAGMLLLCALEGFDSHSYWDAEHPVQQLVRHAVVSFLDVDLEHSEEVLDGCGVPSLCVCLENLAIGYRRLAIAMKHEPETPIGKVGAAMLQNPFMLAGTHRADTEIMRWCSVVVKSGTSGVFGAAIPEKELGIAVKIESGSEDASESVIIEVLSQLGLLDKSASQALEEYRRIIVNTWTGIPAGLYEPVFRLELNL